MGTGGSRPNIPNHLVKAIISTLCCCLPFGIVAIVFAAQVNGKLDAGDYAGAQKASQEANKWGNISIGIGVVVNLLVVGGQILVLVLGAQQGQLGG
ncbi:MAG: CD225/dispanin family protein [Planctomycetota bacterium]|nr:MAG: CD225/dispanin family protein [Planctomycetota bacterium]